MEKIDENDTVSQTYRSGVVNDFKVRLETNVCLDWFWFLEVR